jgi:hypothetical protein
MTKKTGPMPAPPDRKLEKRMARFKDSFEAHVRTIKESLAQWLYEHRPDITATRIALLEIVFDGYLAERTTATSDLASAAAEATDIVQAVLRRAVQRRRAALHIWPAAGRCPARWSIISSPRPTACRSTSRS